MKNKAVAWHGPRNILKTLKTSMFTQNILFCLLCLPVVGALGILFFPKKAVRQMKLFALNVSLCNFLLSLNLWIFF